ncbi:wD repeat domain, partial [Mortierella sp. 14UC]
HKVLQIRSQCLVNDRPPHNYIPALGKIPDALDSTAVPLLPTVTKFLEGKLQVMLLMGDSGSGKTYFLRQLERDLWDKYKGPDAPIPILVRLTSVNKPLSDLMEKTLKSKFCNDAEIRAFKTSNRQFVLICDEYDEIPATGNIYSNNRFNKSGQWRVKLIIACRSYKLGKDSDDRFKPRPESSYDLTDLGLFQKVAMAPFTRTMIESYVEKYVAEPHQQDVSQHFGNGQSASRQLQLEVQEAQPSTEVSRVWSAQDYMDTLTDIPNLMELVENPYILSFILGLLPLLTTPTHNLSRSGVSLDAVYKHIFDNWMEVGKRRLFSKEKNKGESEAFEEMIECGFEEVCMEYLLDLAVEVFKNQDDVSFVQYTPNKPTQWKIKFFGSDPKSRLLQESVPLTRSGSSYRFIHPSLLEYLYSLVVFDPIGSRKDDHGKDLPDADDSSTDGSDSDNSGWDGRRTFLRTSTGTDLKRGQVSQRGQALQRGKTVEKFQMTEQKEATERAQASKRALALKKAQALELEQAKAFEKGHVLGLTNIAKLSMTTQFLADRVQSSPVLKKRMIETVWNSKHRDDTEQTTAANAMTILARSGMRFNGADLRGVKIKGANLTGGELDSADLRGADLSEVIFAKSWLRGARLEGARLTGASFGECHTKLDDTPITSAYSPDGKHFAVVFEQESIVVYNTTTWESVYSLEGFTSGVTSIAFSPNGERLAFGNMDGALRTWLFIETVTTPVLCDKHDAGISDLAYSPDGQYIATASQDGLVRLFEASSGRWVMELNGHLGGVSSVAFSSDGKRLVSGDSVGAVCLWDLETGQPMHPLLGHKGAICKVLFSPNGTQIASSSFDNTVRVWSVVTGSCQRTYSGHLERVISIAYSPDGQQLVSCSEDNTIRMWNSRTGSKGPVFLGHMDHVVSIAYSPDGKHFVSCGRDNKLRRWDCPAATKGAVIFGHTNTASSGVFPYSTVKRHEGGSYRTTRPTLLRSCWANAVVVDSFKERVSNVAVSLDGSLVASASGKLVNLKHKNIHALEHHRTLTGHSNNVTCIVFSPDSQYIASSSNDKTISIWNIHSGKPVCLLVGHTRAVKSVAFSSTGNRLVSGSDDGTVRLWDLSRRDASTGDASTERYLETLKYEGASCSMVSVAISSSGRWVAAGGEDTVVRVWETDNHTGSPHATLRGHRDVVNCVAFSPDNIYLASGGNDGTIRIWNIATSEEERVIEHGGSVKCLAYSPSGEQLASGGDDQHVRTWNVSTGDIEAALEHRDSILSLCYSKEGTQLWTGSADKKVNTWTYVPIVHHPVIASTAEFSKDCRKVSWNPGGKEVQLWSTDSGVPGRILRGHSDCVERLLFSPVHNIIATASRDGKVGLWDTQTGELLRWLEGDIGEAANIMFSPNGNQLTVYSGRKLRLWALSITKSESPSTVGDQGTPLQAGQPRSNVEGQSDQPRLPVQETTVVATKLAAHDVNGVTALMYSPDGKEVAVGTAGEVFLRFDAQSGELLTALVEHSSIVTSIAYSLSGDMLVTGSEDKTARILDRKTGVTKLHLSGHRNRITSVAISPCGEQVATGSADKTICLWSSTFRGPGQILAKHDGPILCIAYSPDGKFLVSGSEDRTMRLWSPTTGALLTTVGDFTAGVKSIRWKTVQGGLCLLTGCEENPLRMWELVEEGEDYKIRCRWGARVDGLAVSGMAIGQESGLEAAERVLLLEKGAVLL